MRSDGGTTTVFALDWNGDRIPQRPDDPNSPSKEVDLELRWVVLTGILDHRTIRQNYTKALKVDPSRAHPEYRRVEVERQVRKPGGEWSDWASVDHDRNRLVLENIPEAEEELAPSRALIRPALVDALPLLKGGQYWTGAHIAALVPLEKKESRRKESPMPRHSGDGDFPKTEALEVLVRSLDFTVEPGLAYRYRARIVAESPLLQGPRRELIGPWSVPTAEVLVPAS